MSHLHTELNTALSINLPIIWVVTHEEDRVVEHLYNQTQAEADPANTIAGAQLNLWSTAHGLVSISERLQGRQDKVTANPNVLLTKIAERARENENKQLNERHLYVLKSFNVLLSDGAARELRDMLRTLVTGKSTLIIVSPLLAYGQHNSHSGVPAVIEKETYVIHVPLQNQEERIKHIKTSIDEVDIKPTEEEIADTASALRGMTTSEINAALTSSIVKYQAINTEEIFQMKSKLINRSDALEMFQKLPEMEDIGGLDNIKEYFRLRKDCMSSRARDFGVEAPNGIIISGIPGTGKSLIAKAVAKMLGLPCYMLQMGRLLSGLVGGSEAKTRSVIQTINGSAPLCLWIDEIEKGMAGVQSSGKLDSGVFARVFSQLLTAMQEEFKDVVVLATANDMSGLPPELVRRFDEVFFVDLPSAEERKEILDIHMRQRNRKMTKVLKKAQVNDLLALTEGFTGAEIEKLVQRAIVNAFSLQKKEVEYADFEASAMSIVPLKNTMEEQIIKMRDWAKGKAASASRTVEPKGAVEVSALASIMNKRVN